MAHQPHEILQIPRLRPWGGRLLGALGVFLFGASTAVLAQPFPLTDSGPASEDFEQRFLANYGVNSAIEPTIGAEERPLYEKIAPFLREDPARVIREVEAALTKESNPAFRFLLGSLHYQGGEMEKAERYLEEAIEQFPDFRRAHRTLGLILVQNGRFEEAIQTWLKVITLGGGDAQSYGLLAYAYLTEEKYESALNAYRMARMFKPDSVDFRRGQAQCLLQTGQWRLAAALFDELIAENPEEGAYWLMQANAFLQLERHPEAIANLELAHSLGEGHARSRFLLGDLHMRAENYRLAVSTYVEAIKASEDWSLDQALQPLNYLLARGLLDEAERYLAVLEPRLPASLERKQEEKLAVTKAHIARAGGELEKARDLLGAVVEVNPLHGKALLSLAGIYQEQDDYEQAEFYFQRALSVPDFKVDALIALGRLEVERGDFSAALEHLRTAREHEERPGLDRYIDSIEAASQGKG